MHLALPNFFRNVFLMPHRMKGARCLWGRGPEPGQGTSLSGTGHPFKYSHSDESAGDIWGDLMSSDPRERWGEEIKRKSDAASLISSA